MPLALLDRVGLPARSIADVVIRQRYLMGLPNRFDDIERAVLADLERLAAREIARTARVEAIPAGRLPAPPEAATASDRRRRVLDLLSSVDTARLPDREIARRVGVSPQTVGNIRRRVAA